MDCLGFAHSDIGILLDSNSPLKQFDTGGQANAVGPYVNDL